MLAPFRLCFFFFFCPPIWRAALRAALAITPLTSTLNNIPFALEKQKRSLVSVIFPCEGKSEKEKRSSQMEIKICDGKAKGSDEKNKARKNNSSAGGKVQQKYLQSVITLWPSAPLPLPLGHPRHFELWTPPPVNRPPNTFACLFSPLAFASLISDALQFYIVK